MIKQSGEAHFADSAFDGVRAGIIAELGWGRPEDEPYIEAATSIMIAVWGFSLLADAPRKAEAGRHGQGAVTAARRLLGLKQPAAVSRQAKLAAAAIRAMNGALMSLPRLLREGWTPERALGAASLFDQISNTGTQGSADTIARETDWLSDVAATCIRAGAESAVMLRLMGQPSGIDWLDKAVLRSPGARKSIKAAGGALRRRPPNTALHLWIQFFGVRYQRETGRAPAVSYDPVRGEFTGPFLEYCRTKLPADVRRPRGSYAFGRAIQRALRQSTYLPVRPL
jgi:hypothetical protein